MKPMIGQFKGNPTITLNPEEQDLRRRFTFGADKARMILACVDEIRQFAEANPPKRKAPPAAAALAAENEALKRKLEALRALQAPPLAVGSDIRAHINGSR